MPPTVMAMDIENPDAKELISMQDNALYEQGPGAAGSMSARLSSSYSTKKGPMTDESEHKNNVGEALSSSTSSADAFASQT
eukprot:724218-Pyramimonas_sp.AAC.2